MAAEVVLSIVMILDAMAIGVGLAWLAAETPKVQLSLCFGGMSITVGTFTAVSRLVLTAGCWSAASDSNDGLAEEVTKQLHARDVNAYADTSDVDVGQVFLLVALLISVAGLSVTCVSARRRTEQDGTRYTRHSNRNPAVTSHPSRPPSRQPQRSAGAPSLAPASEADMKPAPGDGVVVGAVVGKPLEPAGQDAVPASAVAPVPPPKPDPTTSDGAASVVVDAAAPTPSPVAVPVATAPAADSGEVVVSVELDPAPGQQSPDRRDSYVPPNPSAPPPRND